jgi:undecaprenyl diphosphate synthase
MSRPEKPMSKNAMSSAPFSYDGLDRVIHEKARLGLLTSLMAHPRGLAFADLKQLCGLTDGNLSRHLQVLQAAYVVPPDQGRPPSLSRLSRGAGTAGARCRQGCRQRACVRQAARHPVHLISFFFSHRSFAMQSDFQSHLAQKLHVGIIMDGNGRWATRRGLSRLRGHEAGIEAIRRVVEAAPDQGIGTLTLYAFSSDNWRRPRAEVAALMALLRFYLANEVESLVRNGVRLTVIGRRDRLPDGIATAIARAEKATSGGDVLHLRIAVDYSARDAILNAAAKLAGVSAPTREMFSQFVTGEAGLRDVDLIIRTSGEKRLSDFLLWEGAYAELHFTDRMWPEFDADALTEALTSFQRRERRFGGLQSLPLEPAPSL